MHNGWTVGSMAAGGLSWDRAGRRALIVALSLLVAFALMFTLAISPGTASADDLAAGESTMVVAGGSWSGPVTNAASGGTSYQGPSWG